MFPFTVHWAKRSWPFNLDWYAGDVHTLSCTVTSHPEGGDPYNVTTWLLNDL